MTTANPPRVLARVCTLTPSPADSSSGLLARQVPDTAAQTTGWLARNATHLARLLRDSPYPA